MCLWERSALSYDEYLHISRKALPASRSQGPIIPAMPLEQPENEHTGHWKTINSTATFAIYHSRLAIAFKTTSNDQSICARVNSRPTRLSASPVISVFTIRAISLVMRSQSAMQNKCSFLRARRFYC